MPNKLKQVLEKITSEKAPGPSITFSLFHMLQAIELIAEKPMGRGKLAEELKIGEGAVRTVISRLKNAGLIKSSKAGCTLTRKGFKIWDEYKSFFRRKMEIEKNELAFADFNFAVLVKNCGNKVESGMKQRDTAIIMGAKSATTLIFKKGRLIIPSVTDDVRKDFPKAATQIITLLKPEENDVVIVVSADSLDKAKYGSLAAAWTLLE